MKIALIVLAIVAAVSANEYYGKDYQHVPYYKFKWDVTADGGYGYDKDAYKGGPLHYGQDEAREGYHTKGNWHTELPGKGHIKVGYDVDSKHGYKQ